VSRSRPTIHDVAREAQASIATVSRALNGGVVSAAALARIETAVARLGYRRNDVARGLVTGRSGLIGIVLPDLVGPLYAQMARGIEDVLDEHGMHAMLVTDHLEPAAERRSIELLRGRQVDGLVLIGSRLPADALRQALDGTPVAHLQRDGPDDGDPQVRLDDAAGVRAAVRHLLDAGHRRIGHIAGIRRDGLERRDAYLAAMAEAGLEPGPVEVGEFTEEGGEDAAERLLAQRGVTAVFCASDRMAVGLLHAAGRRGLAVPDDLSVVGFDDLSWARYLCPPLTTVRQPGREMGRAAARLVLDGPSEAAGPVLRIAPQLVVRGSTGPPRARAGATAAPIGSATATEEVITQDRSVSPT
jgi:LacI family transcriptional regulator